MRLNRGRPKRVADAESDVERTDYVPVVDVDDPSHADYRTPPAEPDAADDAFAAELLSADVAGPSTPASRARRRVGRIVLGVGTLVIALFVLYVMDLLSNLGDVPRGVTVLGVDVGGMSHTEAEATLRRELGPRLTDPVRISAGDAQARLEPADAGLSLDWRATLEQAGEAPFNPITRAMSLFTTRRVDVVSAVDMPTLRAAVSNLADERLNHPATEGRIDFEPVTGKPKAVHAFAVEPRHGQQLTNVERAAQTVADNWLRSGSVALSVEKTPVQATSAGVHATLKRIVEPMVSAPITVHGKDSTATIEPSTIADSLSFSPREDGKLNVHVDRSVMQEEVQPRLHDTEEEPESARLEFTDSEPSVQPGHKGREIDWAATFEPFVTVAKRGSNRVLPVSYEEVAPDTTTSELKDLGITEVIGKFSTDGLDGAAAHNVATIAGKVNGAIVRPGETFRLNEHAGPHTGAAGYRPAPVREDGTGEEVPAGGVSQFTSTLYNAAYLAGMTDAGHTPHDVYLSRYPAGRDAVSLSPDGASVSMAFTNDTQTGVVIRTDVSGGTVTVTLWGTQHYRVETSSSGRSDIEDAPTKRSTDDDCRAREGSAGFTVSNTRVLHDVDNGDKIRSDTTTATYAPRPKVICHEQDQ